MKKLPLPNIPSVSLPEVVAGAKKRVTDWLAAPTVKHLGHPGQQMTPYDRYRRKKLLKLLNLKDLNEKSVLQVGCGIGDLLLEIAAFQPKEIFGVDTSEEEVEIARKRLEEKGIEADLAVITDPVLPYPDASFDVVLIVQQLQHITQGQLLLHVMSELCRVSRQWLIIVEDTDERRTQRPGYVCRTLEYYKDVCSEHKFHLRKTGYFDIAATRSTFRWAGDPVALLRWFFSPLLYLMGFPRQWLKPPPKHQKQPTDRLSQMFQSVALGLTSGLDEVIKSGRATTKMVFEREKLFRRG